MIGPIRGTRVAAEIKHRLLGLINQAIDGGFTADRACSIIQLDARRYRRWRKRRDDALDWTADRTAFAAPAASQGLADRPPIAKTCPHAITSVERAEILAAADEDVLAHLHHRKLTHHLSRENRVFCSESTTLRVLRSAGKIPVYVRRSRPARPRPELDASEPNKAWRYDGTEFPKAGPYHLIPIIDACSRKITHLSPPASMRSRAIRSRTPRSA